MRSIKSCKMEKVQKKVVFHGYLKDTIDSEESYNKVTPGTLISIINWCNVILENRVLRRIHCIVSLSLYLHVSPTYVASSGK